ncbi:MAG: Arm DNA-binding domain-containing protein [Acidimicrobiia bacterium]
MNGRREKGTGSITERNGRWEARYGFIDTSGNRRQRSSSFATKTEARAWLTARFEEVSAGNIADPGSITVTQYLEEWLGSLGMAQLEAATISWYRSAARSHIIPSGLTSGHRLARRHQDIV